MLWQLLRMRWVIFLACGTSTLRLEMYASRHGVHDDILLKAPTSGISETASTHLRHERTFNSRATLTSYPSYRHEHQRRDRRSFPRQHLFHSPLTPLPGDKYIYFECANLPGYDEVRKKVEAEGKYSMNTICTDATLGFDYDFPAYEFSTHRRGYLDPELTWYPNRVRNSKGYDLESIMHYSSIAPGSGDDVNAAVLTAWVKDGPDVGRGRIIKRNTRISELDRRAIQMIYPWRDGPLPSELPAPECEEVYC